MGLLAHAPHDLGHSVDALGSAHERGRHPLAQVRQIDRVLTGRNIAAGAHRVVQPQDVLERLLKEADGVAQRLDRAC